MPSDCTRPMAGIAPIACVVVTAARPGWYPDPTGRYAHRFHNGRAWTADVADGGDRYVDPLGAAMPQPPDAAAPAGRRNGPAAAAIGLILTIVVVDALEAYRNPAEHETRTIDCRVDDGTAVLTAELTNI